VDGLVGLLSAYDFDAEPWSDFGAARVDAVVAYERVIRAAQARQAAQVAALAAERERQMMPSEAALSVIGEVAMARNVSPSAAGTQYALAMGLSQLPRVAAVFEAGQISEAAARAVVAQTSSLHRDDMVVLDGELAARLPGLTVGRARQAAARAVIGIDAEAARARARAARADQYVSMHAEPDGMAVLAVRGPAEQIVAAHAALDGWARGLRSTGDERTTGQIMVQTLVERVTGQAHADAVDVEVGLVFDAKTAWGDVDQAGRLGDRPAELVGYGPLSPDVAEEIIARARHAWVRRLLVDPVDGTLVSRDPRRRRFDGPLAGFLRERDRGCRQPGCDAAGRDHDHKQPYAAGGATTAANGQVLCRRSHQIKSLPRWDVTTHGRTTIWHTPTGHTYHSQAPPLLPE